MKESERKLKKTKEKKRQQHNIKENERI